MKLYVLCDYCDCEEHGIKGIFTSKENAYSAFANCGLTKKECEQITKKEKAISDFKGKEPYLWVSTTYSSKEKILHFKSKPAKYLGGYELEEVEADILFNKLIG